MQRLSIILGILLVLLLPSVLSAQCVAVGGLSLVVPDVITSGASANVTVIYSPNDASVSPAGRSVTVEVYDNSGYLLKSVTTSTDFEGKAKLRLNIFNEAGDYTIKATSGTLEASKQVKVLKKLDILVLDANPIQYLNQQVTVTWKITDKSGNPIDSAGFYAYALNDYGKIQMQSVVKEGFISTIISTFKPTKVGTYKIELFAKKDGYADAHKEVIVNVQKPDINVRLTLNGRTFVSNSMVLDGFGNKHFDAYITDNNNNPINVQTINLDIISEKSGEQLIKMVPISTGHYVADYDFQPSETGKKQDLYYITLTVKLGEYGVSVSRQYQVNIYTPESNIVVNKGVNYVPYIVAFGGLGALIIFFRRGRKRK